MTLKVTDSDNSVMKCVKRSISADLQGRYDSCDIKKHLKVAIFLDPRFKDLSPIVPNLEHGCVHENTKAEILSLTEESDDEVEGEIVEAPRKKKTKLSDFFQMYTKVLTENILDWNESLQNLADINGGKNENLNIHYCLTWLNDTSACQQQVCVLKKSFLLLEMC